MTKSPHVIVSQRPMSPFWMVIYKMRITSLLSITHRMTGIFLYLGSIVLSWLLFCTVYGEKNLSTAVFANDYFKYAVMLWSAALYYHLFNGIRHLFWDMGKGFEMQTLRKTGYAVVFAAITATILTWCFALGYIKF